MDKLISNFTTVIEGEIDLYRSLYSTLQKEREAILASDLDRIVASSKEKENTILKIRIVDEQRMTLLDRLSEKIDYPPENLTLLRLSELAGTPHKSRLRRLSNTFKVLAQAIHDVNQANRLLLDQSLEFVKTSLGLLGNLISPAPVYHPSGKTENHLHSGMVFSNRV